MPWTFRSATDFADQADQINDFLTLAFAAATPTAGSNTGDGILFGESANNDAVAETWTFTATSATNFTVSGSVSGAQSAATVDLPYVNDYICCTLVAGDTAFVSGDSFTVVIAASTVQWVNQRAVAGNTTDTEPEYIWKGIGSGAEEIYIGIKMYTDWNTYYNWNIQGFTGYDSANVYESQPGYNTSTDRPTLSCSVGAFSFYIVRTSEMVQIVNILGGVYAHAYLGFFDIMGADSQYPYPMIVGGNTSDRDVTLAGVSDDHSWWSGHSTNSFSVLMQGTRLYLGDNIYPYCTSRFADYTESWGGGRDLIPVTILNTSMATTYGSPYGVFAIPNKDAAISVADTFKDENLDFFIVVQNNGLTGNTNNVAVRLE